MEAVYMQQPMPTNITGVPVVLYVLDSNNNYRAIGTTTTNAQRQLRLNWTPDIPGNYTIYATFAGTQSYYGSSASTFIHASSPAATAAPTATPLSGIATQKRARIIGIVAIIIVIVIIGVVIMLMLSRKRPLNKSQKQKLLPFSFFSHLSSLKFKRTQELQNKPSLLD